jgi:hypothetical protein
MSGRWQEKAITAARELMNTPLEENGGAQTQKGATRTEHIYVTVVSDLYWESRFQVRLLPRLPVIFRFFVVFLRQLPQWYIDQAKIVSFQIISNPSFTNFPSIDAKLSETLTPS